MTSPVDELEGIVQHVYATVEGACDGDHPALSVCVAWGPRLFNRLAAKPAGLDVTTPPGAVLLDADLALYVMAREEARLADLKRQLCTSCGGRLTAVVGRHGFQRNDKREPGGFLDGLRNAQDDRERIVFVHRDTSPDEPPAAQGGSYMVTMRIVQNLDTWEALDQPTQEHIIGRRKNDGSRLDLAEGMPVASEGEIAAGTAMPLDSHVAKAGPRGATRDRVRIFRRGLPFTQLTPDGHCEAGLLFVSFQASMDQFRTIADEWMGNPAFPDANTNTDALFRDGHATVTTIGSFFVPAALGAYPGQRFFHPIPEDDRCLGQVIIRKSVQDDSGNVIHTERGGFIFQLFGPDGQPTGDPFVTDSAGRAVSPPVPRGVTYSVHETETRQGFATPDPVNVDVEHRSQLVEIVNKLVPSNPNPGYR